MLTALASAGLSGELEIQREVASCLCNITLESSTRVETSQVCMSAVVHLAQSGDLEAARQAIGALANLAEDIETHAYIGAVGGGRCMIALMNHDALDIHREASRAISNLLTSFHHQADIIQDGLPGLIHRALARRGVPVPRGALLPQAESQPDVPRGPRSTAAASNRCSTCSR